MVLDKFILVTCFIILLIFFFLNIKYRFISTERTKDNEFNKPQAFHNISTPRIGGLFIFFFLIIFSLFFLSKNLIFFKIIYLGFFFFFLGFLEDLKCSIRPEIRLVLMLIGSFFIIYFLDIKIIDLQLSSLNNLVNKNKIISSAFVCLCLIFIINGCNFIDGFNGLLIIHSIIILGILYFINIQNVNDVSIKYFTLFSIIILFFLLFFNFPKAKIFLGDGGAYFIGVIVSLLNIESSNLNKDVQPFFFASILFYVFFEVFFSFFRKIFFLRLSPLKPDDKHLHMLVYKLIVYKVKKIEVANYLTSLSVNFCYLILIFPLFFFYYDKIFCQIYFFILIIIYLLIYLWLKEKNKFFHAKNI